MFEQYVRVYMAPSAFIKAENLLNFLVNYNEELLTNKCKLTIAPETRLFVDALSLEGIISALVKHQLSNARLFSGCVDNCCYRLRDCINEDVKKGKVLVIIGENSYPDLYVGMTEGAIDIAEMKKDGINMIETFYDHLNLSVLTLPGEENN